MRSLQEEFNLSSGDFALLPGEYQGPLVIKRPCVLRGGGATLWADRGPVLVIESPGVTVKDLRVEITGPAAGTAIRTRDPGTALEDVAVCGSVEGLAGESAAWRLPAEVSLGEFASDRENVFCLELEAAGDAELVCPLRDVELFPTRLTAGKNRIDIRVGALRDNTILYGEILVRTAVTRRIYITGKALMGAAPGTGNRLLTPPPPGPGAVVPPEEAVPPMGEGGTVITRGQRLSLEGPGALKIAYCHQFAEAGIEVDAYIFLLGEDGKAGGDSDLLFFGHPEDRGAKVYPVSNAPVAVVEPGELPRRVSRAAVCYSVYGDEPGRDFSRVSAPLVRVFQGSEELCRFPLSELRTEKTVVALELYRYKGGWKLNFVGAGYYGGLKKLCESFGIQVE